MHEELASVMGLRGFGWAELFDLEGNLIDFTVFENKITDYGDTYYAERGAGLGSHVAVQGMQLGTGTTTASKNGAGAAIGTFISGSSIGFVAGYPTSLSTPGSGDLIQFQVGWNAGIATNGAITEVVLHNQSLATNSGAPVGNTVSRAKFATSLNKLAASVLYVTWNHTLLGA